MRRLSITLAAAVILTGCGASATEPPSSSAPTLSHPYDTSPPTSGPEATQEPLPEPARSGPVPVVPRRLTGPQIAANVVPLRLDGTALEPPADPKVLGWWGKRAGAAHGVTLLVGHTVSTGGGTLDDLDLMAVGSTLRVNGLAYTVRSNRIVSKARLARNAERTFRQAGPHRLVVVTCEDFNPATRTYASNVVLTATLRSTR